MKKLLIIMTLFLSSFFFLSLKEVKADEYNIEFDNFDYVGETFLEVKEAADQYINDSSNTYTDYLIYISSGKFYYVAAFSSLSSDSSYCYLEYLDHVSDYRMLCKAISIGKILEYKNGSLSNYSAVNPYSAVSYNPILTPKYSNYFLYSTFDFIYTNTLDIDMSINIKHLDFTLKVNNGDKIHSMYEFYNLYNSPVEENPHQEEIDKVTNFYSMIIEKIGYLADQIVNNYILLFIIGIFILIFVFLLIFRRFIC